MDFFQELFSGVKWEAFSKMALRVLLILAVSWFIAKILKRSLIRLETEIIRKGQEDGVSQSETGKRIETIARLIRQGAMLALYLVISLILLKEVGVDIGPIIASAGIVGIALGFGAQNLVRDLISGFFIIMENQIRVGDVATVNGTSGLVEKINFRTIVLRDNNSGVVHIFPNGSITTLSNSTKEWSAYSFELGVAYKEDTDRVIQIMTEVGEGLYRDENFNGLILENPEIFGVERFDESAVTIKGRIKTRPNRQWDVGREYLRRIKIAFDRNNIAIPFPHRTISIEEIAKVQTAVITKKRPPKKIKKTK